MMVPKLTVCIVSWNTRDLLLEYLGTVYASVTDFDFEVTVVDNNSDDGSAEAVAWKYPQTTLIRNHDNPGFATANNQAIKTSKAPYVLLLNPDTIILPDLLQALVAFMESNPNTGAAGPKLVFPNGATQDSCSLYPPGLEMILIHHGLKRDRPVKLDFLSPVPVASVMGACLIVNRRAIEKIGLMDENFFLIFEEADWCYRLHQGGWGVYYLPEYKVVHYQGQSEKQLAGSGLVETQVSLIWFMFKHYGLAVCLMGFSLTLGIRLWWSLKTAIKMLILGRTDEAAERQTQNKYVISGQIKGLLMLWPKISLLRKIS